jgi:hypothetical protein
MSKINNANLREVYLNSAALIAKAGYSVERAKLTQSEIRCEVAMSTSTTRFHLPILVNDQQNGTAFSSENRLRLTDVFLVSGIRMFAAKPASATAAAGRLYSYGNRTAFNSANTATSIDNAFANGFLTGLIDNDQVLPYWATNKHWRVPATQDAANADYTASAISTVDSNDYSEDTLYPVEPNIVLAGNANLDFNFNIVSAMTAIESNSRFVFVFDGVLAQNVSKIAN